MVPRGRIELPTSSLPMMRSTTELPRLFNDLALMGFEICHQKHSLEPIDSIQYKQIHCFGIHKQHKRYGLESVFGLHKFIKRKRERCLTAQQKMYGFINVFIRRIVLLFGSYRGLQSTTIVTSIICHRPSCVGLSTVVTK